MHVTRLQLSDVQPYRALMLQAYELAADAFTSTAEERAAEPESYWVKRIKDPSGLSVAFGAFEGAQLVGAVTLEFSAKPKTRHKAHVIGLYVVPQARGTGAGRALIDAAVDGARSKDGVCMLTLTVTEGNAPAIKLYSAAGFQVLGVEPMAILTPTGFKAKVHMGLALARTSLGSG